jgi:RNA-directed DNA polymerase
MNENGQSYKPIVPTKSANKLAPEASAERMEGRGMAKGNASERPINRAQQRRMVKEAIKRIGEAAKREPKGKLTTLMHHVYGVDNLREAYFGLKKNAAAGVDAITWQQYGEELEKNLESLSVRLKRGAYRAPAVLRVYVPKADGRLRGLGIPALEDKIVQSMVAKILIAIWEPMFKGFSYGYRPGRSVHDALDALAVGIEKRSINWVFEADIMGFFDHLSHEWLLRMVEHRVGDKRITSLVRQWLKAGVMEEGEWRSSEEGTPQGGIISPVLANIYLHHALDEWVQQWRKREARGPVIVVRYADDFVVGFARPDDAERFQLELRERMEKFTLKLHGGKTRLIEFGRYAESNRKKRGESKPETFNFLGFTHICGKKRDGRFVVMRRTMRKRMQAKLKELKQEFRRRVHEPLKEQGTWISAVLRGYYQHYGIPYNSDAMESFLYHVKRLWRRALSRRSQKAELTLEKFGKLTAHWLPKPRICHPYPTQRLSKRFAL